MNTIETKSGQQITFEKFSPARAEKILNSHNDANRTLREGIAEKYAADMKAGAWTFCTAPIVFYEDSTELGDGQHRLWAVVVSGTTQEFVVIRGLPRPAALNVDTGLTRNVIDNAKFAGIDLHLSNEMLSISRAYAFGEASFSRGARSRSLMSNLEKVELVRKYEEPVHWAVTHGPSGVGLRNSSIVGAIARAYMHERDKDRLAEFSKVLTTGFGNGDADTAAITLRNKLKEQRGVPQGQWREMFLKAQNCIWYFCHRKKLTVLKTVKDEQYPLKGKK